MPRKKKVEKSAVDAATNEDFEPDAFVIRTSEADGTSRNSFKWPREIGAIASAPDWKPTTECGNGLHGLLDGVGEWGRLSSAHDALWWIIGVKRSECIDLDGKVKFPRGKVMYFGGINGALNTIAKEWRNVALKAAGEAKEGATSTSGVRAHASTSGVRAHASTSGYEAHTSTSGYEAHASTSGVRAHASTSGVRAHASTSGDYAHASTSGYEAHASTSGDYAHASTSGDYAHASTSGVRAHASTSGVRAHASTSGVRAHASTSGYEAHASTSGDYAHASTSGYEAHASTSGDYAHASTSGDYAHASTSKPKCVSSGLGYASRARASIDGAICLVNRDNKLNIIAIRASKVGENGIKPDTWYELDANGNFVEV